jgi:hypothetical protein
MNTYFMLQLLRDQIAEAVASHWDDDKLVGRLNIAQRKTAILVQGYPGAWLLESADLTPVDSVITLPSDCAKPVYMEEKSSGRPISWLENVRTRRVSRTVGASLDLWTGAPEAYPLLNTLEVNESGYATEVTLWYDVRVPDLMAGTAATGSGATVLVFPDESPVKHIDDYYNGVGIEVESGTGAATVGDVISDYTGVDRSCVVSGTYDNTSVFGTISRLPEESHPLILADATVLAVAKPSSNIDKEIFQYYVNERRDVKRDLKEWLETRIKGHRRVEVTEAFV